MPRTVPIEMKVSELPMFRRLYQAVDDYLWCQLREQGGRTPRTHATWCELIDAHDAIAAHLARLLTGSETSALRDSEGMEERLRSTIAGDEG